ncbi:hypothetical protein WJX77_006913 [Trebouxia sp. C0004]
MLPDVGKTIHGVHAKLLKHAGQNQTKLKVRQHGKASVWVQIDLIDMRKYEYAGYKWVLTTKDHMSRSVIFDALKSKTALEVVQAVRKPREQISRPGTTCEEQPIIDLADVEHLLTDIEQPAEIHESTAQHDQPAVQPEQSGSRPLDSGEVDFAVSPCQHSGKATTGKGRSAATRKDQSIGRPATIAAAKTSAQMTARDAHPDVHEDGSYQSSDDSEGPHKQIRHEDLETLKKTRARMVKNHNRQSRVRSFQVGDCVGVKVDRADRGHCDRKFVPCLIIG